MSFVESFGIGGGGFETGEVRQPYVSLTINGSLFNVIDCEVTQVGNSDGHSTNSFEATLALDDPAGEPAAWWSTLPSSAQASIFGDNGDGSGAGVLLTGTVTHVSVNFEERTVHVSGSGMLQQGAVTRNDQSYVNQPISSVVSQIAGTIGLGVSINAPNASQMAGKTYDQQNYAFVTDMQTALDALQQMAHQAGATLTEHNGTLYFNAPGSSSGGSYNIFYIPPTPESFASSNSVRLIGKYIPGTPSQATAVSQDIETKTANTAQGQAQGFGGGDTTNVYHKSIGDTSAQTQTAAQNRAAEVAQLAYEIEIVMPGDATLNPTMQLTLSGTESGWDNTYHITKVEHRFHVEHGYDMSISAQTAGGGGGA